MPYDTQSYLDEQTLPEPANSRMTRRSRPHKLFFHLLGAVDLLQRPTDVPILGDFSYLRSSYRMALPSMAQIGRVEQFSLKDGQQSERLQHLKQLLVLVAMLLICLGGGLFCYSRESRAIAEIEAMGGIVHHRCQLAPWMAAYVGEEPRKLLAEKSITFLDVGGNLSNVNLERLRSSILAISNVRKVALGGPSIDYGWLLHLHSLRHVRDVAIEGTQISDDGIRYLSDPGRIWRTQPALPTRRWGPSSNTPKFVRCSIPK